MDERHSSVLSKAQYRQRCSPFTPSLLQRRLDIINIYAWGVAEVHREFGFAGFELLYDGVEWQHRLCLLAVQSNI